jgi:hypothetical protein
MGISFSALGNNCKNVSASDAQGKGGRKKSISNGNQFLLSLQSQENDLKASDL